MPAEERPRRRERPSLARKAKVLAAREGHFPRGTRALVMVSGGQDSLALLHLLSQGRLRPAGPDSLCALHINHHLRGAESDADEALVTQACTAMGVSLTVVHRPIDKQAGSVQEAARDARRQAALAVAGQRECGRIVLGHTADDQVETMLYRLGRYGGMAAFAAMKSCDPPWVRPLLGCRREETALYCREHGLEFADDRGNVYPGYARTAIREKVLPAWEVALPGAVEAACRASEVASELLEVADVVIDREMPGLTEAEELSVARLSELSPAVRRLVLHGWLEARARPAASRAGVLAVESLLKSTGSAQRSLGDGWLACREYDRLFLERRSQDRRSQDRRGSAPRPGVRGCGAPGAEAPGPAPLPVPGSACWGDVTVHAEFVDAYSAPDVRSEAYLDAASLDGSLEVRGPRAGDRVRPLGAPGKRKLQDVLVDLHVPAKERAHVPLVVCGERIVWVGGLVLAEEGRINDATAAIVRLSLERRQEGGSGDPVGEGRGGRG